MRERVSKVSLCMLLLFLAFCPYAGSHIFYDQSASMSKATEEAAELAALAAARLAEARARAAERTPSQSNSSSSKTALSGAATGPAEGNDWEREAGLAAVKQKILELQSQNPGDAAKYLAALPASLKWRCFLGVSPAQRAAIMLEMSTDERKLALSMLRPGERTIAERFLGIKHKAAESQLQVSGSNRAWSAEHTLLDSSAAPANATRSDVYGPAHEGQQAAAVTSVSTQMLFSITIRTIYFQLFIHACKN
jgi:hypothetical protein